LQSSCWASFYHRRLDIKKVLREFSGNFSGNQNKSNIIDFIILFDKIFITILGSRDSGCLAAATGLEEVLAVKLLQRVLAVWLLLQQAREEVLSSSEDEIFIDYGRRNHAYFM